MTRALTLALLLAATPALALERGDTITGVVERVKDGDTFVVNGVTVRLEGIDTPESKQEPRSQGAQARATLESLALGKEASCEIADMDRYGRAIARCAVDGSDVAADLIRAGMGWNYWQYAGDLYAEEEEEAACARRGIWAAGILPPWHWRACGR